MHEQTISRDPSLNERAFDALLVGAIFLGSLVLWIGIPLAWVWGASQLVSEYPVVYALAILGCPATMVAWAWVLHRLNAIHLDIAAPPDDLPGSQRAAWLKSLSGERGPVKRHLGVLEISSMISVVIAIVAIGVWFFFFAEMHLAPL